MRARLAAPGLAADMAAFKAANPGACLADFVRWHSPWDWLPLPPPGRLSPRMAHPVRCHLMFQAPLPVLCCLASPAPMSATSPCRIAPSTSAQWCDGLRSLRAH